MGRWPRILPGQHLLKQQADPGRPVRGADPLPAWSPKDQQPEIERRALDGEALLAQGGTREWSFILILFVRSKNGELSIHMDDSASVPELTEFESELAKLAIILDSRFSQFSSVDITTDISKGSLLEDVLSRIYDSFQRIIPYDRIGCALLGFVQRDFLCRPAVENNSDVDLLQSVALENARTVSGCALASIPT